MQSCVIYTRPGIKHLSCFNHRILRLIHPIFLSNSPFHIFEIKKFLTFVHGSKQYDDRLSNDGQNSSSDDISDYLQNNLTRNFELPEHHDPRLSIKRFSFSFYSLIIINFLRAHAILPTSFVSIPRELL